MLLVAYTCLYVRNGDRYRNFRTFVTPTPKQFVSLAADHSGEVICAGTLDSFEVLIFTIYEFEIPM